MPLCRPRAGFAGQLCRAVPQAGRDRACLHAADAPHGVREFHFSCPDCWRKSARPSAPDAACSFTGRPATAKRWSPRDWAGSCTLTAAKSMSPYAIQAENTIITVFDPAVHQTTDDAELAHRGIVSMESASVPPASTITSRFDLRWRRIRRPVVITGGELTLEMLDLQYHESGILQFAAAHQGQRRRVSDRRLRPADRSAPAICSTAGSAAGRPDRLSDAGDRQKLTMPFEQFIVFSTNLDPTRSGRRRLFAAHPPQN